MGVVRVPDALQRQRCCAEQGPRRRHGTTPREGPRLCNASLKKRCVASGARDLSVQHEFFPRRHCEEPLRRSNPESLRGKILDCFAALAMTTWKECSLK